MVTRTGDTRTQRLDERPDSFSVSMTSVGVPSCASRALSASDTGAARALARMIESAGERSAFVEARPVYRTIAPATDAHGLIRRPPELSAA